MDQVHLEHAAAARLADRERRALWHDPLTNEQWFGLRAHDPVRAGWRVLDEQPAGVRELAVDHDASWAYVRVRLTAPPTAPVRLGFDVVPGGPDDLDVRVDVDPAARTALAQVRADLDPLQLDRQRPADLPAAGPDGWSVQRLSTNRALTVAGGACPRSTSRSASCARGPGTPPRRPWTAGPPGTWTARCSSCACPGRCSCSATPAAARPSVRSTARRRRSRWPTSASSWTPAPGGRSVGRLRWEGWQRAQATERLKPGVQPLVDAWAELGGPTG